MKRIDTVTSGWHEYELIDSGEGEKLERFGTALLIRPDPQVLWTKSALDAWKHATAHFIWKESGERWNVTAGTPESWTVSWGDMKLELSLKGFKHIGMFPEHEKQWQEIFTVCKAVASPRVLNLFGYTGAASIVAAQAGATVTHVDASKQTIQTLKENINLSELPADAIRTVCEDALRYAKRLVERDEQFEVIIMDPPAFGRGPKGEVWKIEEKLPELIALVPKLLSKDAKLVLLNGYASGYSARSFGELLHDILPNGTITYGDVGIQQKNSDRVLTTGMYAKWLSL
jgi:23S rRNA (cytosine1962-C5)-methyltransferase